MATQEKQTTAVAKKKEDVTKIVLNKIQAFQESGELTLPPNYSAENAIKSAYLVLQEVKTSDKKPALEACSQSSIASALLKMVVYGLSPIKNQLYFIAYANKLECTVSYMGEILLAKRYANLKHITANVIKEGEDFEFVVNPETGRRKVIKHNQTLQSIGGNKILGAYAIYELNDGTRDMDVMTMEQIQTSWDQGSNSPAKKKFAEEMCKRTILKRAIKLLLRSSDDAALYDGVDREPTDVAKEDVKYKVAQEANLETIDIDAEEVVEEVQETEQPQPQEQPKETVGEQQKAF